MYNRVIQKNQEARETCWKEWRRFCRKTALILNKDVLYYQLANEANLGWPAPPAYQDPIDSKDDWRQFTECRAGIEKEDKDFFANFYELLDGNTSGFNPEDHYGIRTTADSAKVGYDALKKQIQGAEISSLSSSVKSLSVPPSEPLPPATPIKIDGHCVDWDLKDPKDSTVIASASATSWDNPAGHLTSFENHEDVKEGTVLEIGGKDKGWTWVGETSTTENPSVLTLVTANVRHFQGISGLKIENRV